MLISCLFLYAYFSFILDLLVSLISCHSKQAKEKVMDDSMINPILLSSSVYLENVEQLIKNLEKQTINVEDILNNHDKQETIIKSFSSDTMPINDMSDDNFLIKSLIF